MLNHFSKQTTSSFFILSIMLGLTGCTKQDFKSLMVKAGLEEGIFSNRPQTMDKSIVILKLKSPALLSSVTYENGQKKVDQDLLKAIHLEQNQLLTDLKALSSEIKVLYRYRMVLNGVAVITPTSLLEKLKAYGSIAYMEGEGSFGRPIVLDQQAVKAGSLSERNSVNFIGADQVHQMKIKTAQGEVSVDGTGMKVGIIDTGIDYTHAMMKGAGTEQAYKAIDPAKPNAAFPNEKVVGGIDLVGTDYNSASSNFKARIPVPDENPLDEGGHGSHVSGTVAGLGDGVNTYDGVAPGAKLYAIKVFGADGSTGDAVVIAGLEYAADISASGDPSQQLDVVNLSLGSSYGFPHILYNEAITNLSRGGTVVVASAGNSGPNDYIVGAPSVADDAISVAASVDFTDHNWKFPAVKFSTPSQGEIITEAIEAPIARPISEADISGPLVFIGLADQDLTEELTSKVNGKVAFIDRGKVNFADKIKRAQKAGAIGVVVGNNQPGEPFKMGGSGQFQIPAVMISQALASSLKTEMTKGEVSIRFKNTEKIEKPERIDTITSFSSKGPRSFDAAIKPEISSPGENVISAEMGGGTNAVQMSGTSMAAPHIAGVMTLLKQLHPELSSVELKSILMSKAKSISDKDKNEYSISLQGAGRVQAFESAKVQALTSPSAISLGELNLSSKKVVNAKLDIKNIAKNNINVLVQFRAHAKGISLQGAPAVTIATGETKSIALSFVLDGASLSEPIKELDGFLTLDTGGDKLTVPVLAVVKKISAVKASELKVLSSKEDSAGASVELTLKNSGKNSGEFMVFNMLGSDSRKANPDQDKNLNTSCDLQAAGYRILDKDGQKVLQVAAKLYQPQTTWNMCEVSLLLDTNGDGTPEQELAGIALGNLQGLSSGGNDEKFMSVLLDAKKAREIRHDFELASQAGAGAEENYIDAVLQLSPMLAVTHSTVAVIETPLSQLATTDVGRISVRLATITADESARRADDFLERKADQWTSISIQENSQAYFGMPEKTVLNAGQQKTLTLTKGEGAQKLLILYPQNGNVFSDLVVDGQAQVLNPKFQE